jgi:hypothetical protein
MISALRTEVDYREHLHLAHHLSSSYPTVERRARKVSMTTETIYYYLYKDTVQIYMT